MVRRKGACGKTRKYDGKGKGVGKMKYNRNATPKGYRHTWKYGGGLWDETKISPSTWKFTYKSSKGKKAKGYGSFKKGFTVAWKINAKQTAIKTGKGSYDTIMKGTKKLIRTGNKR